MHDAMQVRTVRMQKIETWTIKSGMLYVLAIGWLCIQVWLNISMM